MKRIHQTIKVAVNAMLMTLAISGCALISGDTDSKNEIDIVTVSSDHAHLSRVTVIPRESGLLISGEVHKKFDARPYPWPCGCRTDCKQWYGFSH